MATNINRGAQQITIYPYQEITSLNANQILYGLLKPGVSNINVSLYSPSNNAFIGVQIDRGATFIFEQSLIENGVTRKFLIKCVLEDDVNIETLPKSTFWSATSYNVNQLYIYANLNYSLASPDYRYADFNMSGNKVAVENDQDLVVATLLNHQYFVKKYTIDPLELDLPLAQYRISYQDQKNANVMEELHQETTQFTPIIEGEMQSVTIAGGYFISGNTISYKATETVAIPDKVSSSLYPAGKSEADLYQIDTLRLKINKGTTRLAMFEWESTLLDKPTSGDWTWTTSYGWTEDKLIAYLKDKPLNLKDSGNILLIAVRPCDAQVITDPLLYSSWAESGFNKIFPANCIIPKKGMLKLDEQDLHSRFKLPIYETTDLV